MTKCKSCNIELENHLGLQGTCEELQALKKNEERQAWDRYAAGFRDPDQVNCLAVDAAEFADALLKERRERFK